MSEVSAASAARCPTCFEGICPSVNTTPDCPEPDPARVARAMRVIPDILVEEFGFNGLYQAAASRLVECLRQTEYGAHRMHVAKWAIYRLIGEGMLSVHEGSIFYPPSPIDRPKRIRTAHGFVGYERTPALPRVAQTYGDAPAPFDSFDVRAEKALWQWWNEEVNKTQVIEPPSKTGTHPPGSTDQPTFRPKELAKELGIQSTNTLNKYAKAAHVTTPKRGKRNHKYTENERRLIYQQVEKDAPPDSAKRARELLTEIERKSQGNRTEIEILTTDRN